MASEYEKLRQKNLEDNRKVLAELGLMNPFKPLPRVIHSAPKRKRAASPQKPRKAFVVNTSSNENIEGYGSVRGSVRRSSRIQGKEAQDENAIKEEVAEWEESEGPKLKAPPNRPNVYGVIPGVEIGTVWPTRLECCIAGIHRPTVAGIHAGPEGCYSIALSGGYDDNIDLGEVFTYTGEGGRDLKGTKANPKNLRTAPQSKDQTLTRGNLALSKNVETGHPVRVIRGFKLAPFSPFAPEEGYRYDGLYKVEKFWYTVGVSGFGVYKFAMKRLESQAPPPWTFKEEPAMMDKIEENNNSKTEVSKEKDPKETSPETMSEEEKEQSKDEAEIEPKQEVKKESGSKPKVKKNEEKEKEKVESEKAESKNENKNDAKDASSPETSKTVKNKQKDLDNSHNVSNISDVGR